MCVWEGLLWCLCGVHVLGDLPGLGPYEASSITRQTGGQGGGGVRELMT